MTAPTDPLDQSRGMALHGESQALLMLGQLIGEVRTMHTSLTARVDDIKDSIRRMEAAQNERISRVEDAANKRIDGLGTRVTALEAEDKRIVEKVARYGALGGGVGGTIAAAIVEFAKRM